MKNCLFAIALCLPMGAAFAQTAGSITGEVKDPSGAVAPNAAVTVTNSETNVARATVTNTAGIYSFPDLTPGTYQIRVAAAGFATVVKTNIELQVQQTTRVDFNLTVGTANQMIEVTSSGGLLSTENATVGTVIEEKRISELPLNGRNFFSLVALAPNVAFGFLPAQQASGRLGGTRSTLTMSLSGARATWANYTLDGITNTDVDFNTYILLPSVEALQEFKVQSGVYPAEFGREAGQVNVSTKPGTNNYHGTVFEFLRNNVLDARAYDFSSSTRSATNPSPVSQPYRQNQYGFTLGGPIQIPKLFNGKNRLFFMSNYEGFKSRQATTAFATTMTQAMRNGDFSAIPTVLQDPLSRTGTPPNVLTEPYPGNQVPQNRIDKTSLLLMKFFPLPNQPVLPGTPNRNYQYTVNTPVDKDQFNQRIDFNESAKSQWFGRYSWTDELTVNPGLTTDGQTLYSRASQWVLSNVRILSPSKVNEARFGYSSLFNNITQQLAGIEDVDAELGVPVKITDKNSWGIPNIVLGNNLSSFGNPTSSPFQINDRIYQGMDNFSWVIGKHALRMGGEYRYNQFPQVGNEFPRGQFFFTGAFTGNPNTQSTGYAGADFLQDYITQTIIAVSLVSSDFRNHEWAAYVDDTWKVTPRVTITAGLRWEVALPLLDVSGHSVNVQLNYNGIPNVANLPDKSQHPVYVRTGSGDFYEGVNFRYQPYWATTASGANIGGSPLQLARDGRMGNRLIKPDYNNFAPRLGIAWSPSEKWSVRAGFGFFYSQESKNSIFDLNRGLGGRTSYNPDTTYSQPQNVTYSNFLNAASLPVNLPIGLTWGADYNLPTTYTMQYVLNIQRLIGNSTTLEVGYNGSESRHLDNLLNPGQPIPGNAPIVTRMPYPEWGPAGIQFLKADGVGNYNGISGKVSQRFGTQPSGQAGSRIQDFRTRGEQPFTALIESQFAEQPPQTKVKGLPNEGRKVLVFSDGRQKAARLAPALEHSHARDLFRQVVALGAHELQTQGHTTGMQWLYPAVVWLCANRGFDLFPSADEVEFHNHLRRAKLKSSLEECLRLANQGGLKPTKSFAQALFSEMTDRYYSLASLGIGTVEECAEFDDVFNDFPNVGLELSAQKALFRAWVRIHLERRSFRPEGAEIRELGEGWATPQGINADKMSQVLPGRFEDYLRVVLSGEDKATALVADWFQRLVRNSDLLNFENDLYYLRPLGLTLRLRLDDGWLRCVDCGRIHPESLADVCPGCLGRLVEADADYLDARTGFYRDQVRRAFDPAQLEPFGLSAAEHSAQLTGDPDDSAFNRVEEYELRFQDVSLDGQLPIDILSCTTTMEVGIDIGALSGVALRNVPPHVANYQQRAGRAGRRGRSIASVVTYAHGTSHDAHFFEHPEQMISGDVRPPVVYVENQKVLERHIFAYLVQRFFHERVPSNTKSKAYELFESLGTVEQFLSERYPCSLGRMETWLSENGEALRQELREWVPTFSHGLQESIPCVAETVESAVDTLLSRLRFVLPVNEYSIRDQLETVAKEALERRLEESLLKTLIGRAVFPRYAFPTDVVSFWVSRPRRPGESSGQRVYDYEPQRDLQLALSEYAPGRSLTIDKWRFESAALFSPYEPNPAPVLAGRQPYTACRSCSFVSLAPESATATICPCCGSNELEHTSFVTPSGFAPDINEKREVDRGEPIIYAGITERAQLEVQEISGEWESELYGGRLKVWTGPQMLAMVNKGVKNRGFRICPDCGRAEPEFGPGFTGTKLTKAGVPVQHKHPLEMGVICTGIADGPYFLGHRFPTDVLLLRVLVTSPTRLGTPQTPGLLSRAARMALSSLVEAIALAASRKLQIDEGELSGWWAPVMGGRTDEAQLYLYDLLPGGAGYARAVGLALTEVLDATEELLSECDCAQSCYRCIRHYRNNYIHGSLDRHLALALLRHVRYSINPSISSSESVAASLGLQEYLQLRGIPQESGVMVDGTEVPMIVRPGGREVWVDFHHALINPEAALSSVALKARATFKEFLDLDVFTLVHDLPSAVARFRFQQGYSS